MAIPQHVIALDQGTTSSRAILYDQSGKELKIASRELAVEFPRDAWVEQDPLDIWNTQREALAEVISAVSPADVKCIGLTNQRETTIVWNPKTGEPLAPAIVWQCRRSADICSELRAQGWQDKVSEKTGLVIDAYFSATKILWLLQNIAGLPEKLAAGTAVFGTVDSWILYNLSGGADGGVFKTEPSNACRTMLFNSSTGAWDSDLLELCGLQVQHLAEIVPSATLFAHCRLFGEAIPLTGILGDQQASLLGHGCIETNTSKCTFGTGAFLLLNSGEERLRSDSGLLSSVGWQLAETSNYVLEGSIFVAGSLIQWLRDGLQLFSDAADSEELASSVSDSAGVILVPAFVGLGAPHWNEDARGALFGLTRDSKPAHITRAAFEGIAHQVADILETKELSKVPRIKVDGGMTRNKLFCQILADITQREVEISPRAEVTCTGAARAALLGLGAYQTLDEVCRGFASLRSEDCTVLSPMLSEESQQVMRRAWQKAIARVSS